VAGGREAASGRGAAATEPRPDGPRWRNLRDLSAAGFWQGPLLFHWAGSTEGKRGCIARERDIIIFLGERFHVWHTRLASSMGGENGSFSPSLHPIALRRFVRILEAERRRATGQRNSVARFVPRPRAGTGCECSASGLGETGWSLTCRNMAEPIGFARSSAAASSFAQGDREATPGVQTDTLLHFCRLCFSRGSSSISLITLLGVLSSGRQPALSARLTGTRTYQQECQRWRPPVVWAVLDAGQGANPLLELVQARGLVSGRKVQFLDCGSVGRCLDFTFCDTCWALADSDMF
jgi:hypothetical protein